MTFPIVLAGLIHLKLRKLFLQAALYHLAFLKGQAEVIESRSLDHAFDNCNFSTLSSPTNSTTTFGFNCDIHEYPSEKGSGYAIILTPTFFPLPDCPWRRQ